MARKVRHFYTKVVGVTQGNRQKIIKSCKKHEMLSFEHEEDNPVDPNAVKVSRRNGKQIGYLNRDLAEEIVSRAESGHRYAIFISEVTGGGIFSKLTRGVNLIVIVAEPGISDEEAQAYIDSVGFG